MSPGLAFTNRTFKGVSFSFNFSLSSILLSVSVCKHSLRLCGATEKKRHCFLKPLFIGENEESLASGKSRTAETDFSLPSSCLKCLTFLETPVIWQWLFGLWKLPMITAAGGLQRQDELALPRLRRFLSKHRLPISWIKSKTVHSSSAICYWSLFTARLGT